MNENSTIKQAYPDFSPDASVRQEAMSHATKLHGQHRQRVRTRNTILGSVASVGIVLGTMVVGPKASAYYRYQQIAGSVNDCKTAVTESFSIKDDGTVVSRGKQFYDTGKWRLEDERAISIYRDGTYWVYSPAKNKVTKTSKSGGPFAYNPSGFSVKAMLEDMARWQWTSTKVSVGSEVLDGKDAEVLTLQSMPNSRQKVYADPKTHMPYRVTDEVQTEKGWKLRGYSTMKFNSPVDARQFAVQFPKEARLVNLDTLKEDWTKKLETPIATLTSKIAKVVIRDYFINRRGHIFVIFTDGETKQDRENYGKLMREHKVPQDFHRVPKFSVKDSTGAEYLLSEGFQPYMNSVGSQKDKWVSLKDGQVIQGAWLIPAKPMTWESKTLTFGFEAYVDPYNDESSSSWSIEVPKTDPGLLPDWIDLCCLAPHTEKELIAGENNVHLVPEMMELDPKTGKPKSNIVKFKYGR